MWEGGFENTVDLKSSFGVRFDFGDRVERAHNKECLLKYSVFNDYLQWAWKNSLTDECLTASNKRVGQSMWEGGLENTSDLKK